MKKKRKKIETPTNINSITFHKINNNKINKNPYQSKIVLLNSSLKNKKRNKSNNDRAKLLLPLETSEFNFFKNEYTLSSNVRTTNYCPKRNRNYLIFLKYKTKLKSNSNQKFFCDKDDSINNTINNNKYTLNNGIYKKFKIEDNIMKPIHRKQNSYNDNNFYLKIKRNIIKAHDLKNKKIFKIKNEFWKKEMQKANNNSNHKNTNTISNINDHKNSSIKDSFANFKKINLKNIDLISNNRRKRLQIELNNKNIEKNFNLNRFSLNSNIFNLYKTLNQTEKKDEHIIFNNTTDKLLNNKINLRKINHQKTISYNFNSTRNLNNMISKNKFRNKFINNHMSKIKSVKRNSQNEKNIIQARRNKNKKEQKFIFIKNMFKNRFFDNFYYTQDNINNSINEAKSKNKRIKTIKKA